MRTSQIKSSYGKLMTTYKNMKVAEADAAKAKKKYEDQKSKMMDHMAHAGTATYKGNRGIVSLTEAEVPSVKDWNKFNKYVMKHKALDLLQRRVSVTAWRDRLEAGENIPGVDKFVKYSLRVAQSK
jgi:hypothetical protein